MPIPLDPDQWLPVSHSDVPLFPVPMHWSSVLAIFRSPEYDVPRVMHNVVGVTLSRAEALALAGIPTSLHEPQCPNCSTPMRLVNSRGRQFFGCPNYPRCQERMALKELLVVEPTP